MIEAIVIFGFFLVLSAITMLGLSFFQIRYGSIKDLDPNSLLVRLFAKQPSVKLDLEQSSAPADLAELDPGPSIPADADSLWSPLTSDKPVTYLTTNFKISRSPQREIVHIWRFAWDLSEPPSQPQSKLVETLTDVVDKLATSGRARRCEYRITPEGDVIVTPLLVPRSSEVGDFVEDWESEEPPTAQIPSESKPN